MLWDKILQLFDHVKNYILTNLADWMIGAIVAFISVRIATRDYYIENRLEVAKRIMEQTLSELLEIKYNQKMPSQAQAIMVKYGGHCFVVDERSKCKFGERIRKTVAVVGGNTSDVSRIRPLYYGVLGVANELGVPMLCDFANKGKMCKYEKGQVIDIENLERDEDSVYYTVRPGKKLFVAKINSARKFMMAIPISCNGKLVGGITFDFTGEEFNDNEEFAKSKCEEAFNVCSDVAEDLALAYFNKKRVF